MSQAQLFYFDETETTLIKTTDQSPAHWYIEIFSNAAVDTVLQWEAEFVNIPSEWTINLDCQSTWFPEVNHNDTGEFLFWSDPVLPQKLIIGAMLNDTPGNGTTLFKISNPEDPSVQEQIAFHFLISQGTASLGSEIPEYPFVVMNNDVRLKDGGLFQASVLDGAGRTLFLPENSIHALDLSTFGQQLLLIHLSTNSNQHFFLKILPH